MIHPLDPRVPGQIRILDIPVSIVDLERATDLVCDWAAHEGARTVFVREVASLMAAVDEKQLAELHEKADLVVADGTPLVWVARMKGCGKEIGRVAGADLVDAVCKQSLKAGQSHFFFGGKSGVAEQMAEQLCARYSGLKVAGTYSPPMRSIGPDFELDGESLAEIEKIRAADPNFIWIGISSPKQEYWMMRAAQLLRHGVFFGVGAAFDFHSGQIKRAPRWMRDNGLEWLHRLVSEPRRLWRRYAVLAPRFAIKAAIELAFYWSGANSIRHKKNHLFDKN